MLIMFKVVVAAAGTPGPLLGDGTNTTVTMLMPATLTEANDTLGSRQSVINQTTRKHYSVARLTLVARLGNTNGMHYGGAGTALADMIEAAPGAVAPGMPLGNGVTDSINLGDLDVDADANNNEWIVIAESM